MQQSLPKRRQLQLFCLLLVACLLLFAVCFEKKQRHTRELLYYDTVLSAAAAYSVSPALVLAVIRAESDFDPNASSSKGAAGLMQLMPSTYQYLRDTVFKEPLADDAILLPTVNIRYGTYYLSYLMQTFACLDTALAAYNAGEGRVFGWLNDKTLSKDGKTLDTIPFRETEKYVLKTKEYYQHYIKKFRLKEQV